MIIECSTLEQIKDVMRINNINNWNKTDLIRHLEKGHLCIRIYKGFGYDHRNNYKELYPELPIVSYEDYIKTHTPTITLRAEIWDSTLIVQCITCKPFETVEKDGFELVYKDSIILCKSYADLSCKEGSCNLDTLHFINPQEAQAYLDKLLELVELVNKPVPVVDLNRVGSYKLGHLTSLAVGDTFVTLVKNAKCVAEYSKKQLSPQIIKVQLEQILEHLGVKAQVKI